MVSSINLSFTHVMLMGWSISCVSRKLFFITFLSFILSTLSFNLLFWSIRLLNSFSRSNYFRRSSLSSSRSIYSRNSRMVRIRCYCCPIIYETWFCFRLADITDLSNITIFAYLIAKNFTPISSSYWIFN